MSGLNFGPATAPLLTGPLPGMAEPDGEPDQELAEGPPALPPIIDPTTGIPMYPQPNGDIVIGKKVGPQASEEGSDDFDDNLCERLDQQRRTSLAQELLRGYKSDVESRRDYMQSLADGIDLLGLKIEKPTTQAGDASAPAEGLSTQRSHLLLEAVVRGQSNAHAELLPANGPVKIVDDGDETEERMIAAEDLERAMNHYLKPGGIATEYYPDTDHLLFRAFYAGCCFRKVYHCPLRNRPVAESVAPENIIINWAATDIPNAGRVTHRQAMQNHLVKSMQRLGHWRDVTLSMPTIDPTVTERKEGELEGKTMVPSLQEDYPHTILEMYVDRDLKDYGVPNRGQKNGMPVPYRVVIEETSQEILEIRRNWREGDELFRKRRRFVKYPIIPGFGFYDYGFLHLLGNDTMALTAMLRMTIDAGQFANFPGYLYSSLMGRQDTSIFRVPPGGGVAIDTGGEPIGDMITKLPYGGPNETLVNLMGAVERGGQRLGGTADMPVGEGRQDAPVGTTIALIEQATKVVAAVHKRLHAAQAEEFQILRELFQEDPEALWRGMDDSPLLDKNKEPPDAEMIVKALNDYRMIPQADPNVPSHMHRIMLAMAISQMAAQNPLYDEVAVEKFKLRTMGMSPDELLKPQPQQQQPDPAAAAKAQDVQLKQQELQQKGQEIQLKGLQAQQSGQQKMQELVFTGQQKERDGQIRMRELAIESQDRAADRESRERVADLHAGLDQAQHTDNVGLKLAGLNMDHAQHHDHMADSAADRMAGMMPAAPRFNGVAP